MGGEINGWDFKRRRLRKEEFYRKYGDRNR